MPNILQSSMMRTFIDALGKMEKRGFRSHSSDLKKSDTSLSENGPYKSPSSTSSFIVLSKSLCSSLEI